MKVWDSEENEFEVIGGDESSFTLKGLGGEKKIAIDDLKFYSSTPPDVRVASEKLLGMLKRGELSQDELKRMKEDL